MKLFNAFLFCAALSLNAACALAADPKNGSAANDMQLNAQKAATTLGKEADKAEHAIVNGTKTMGANLSKAANNAKANADQKNAAPKSDLQKNAQNAMTDLGKQADKAEHAIVSGAKNMGAGIQKADKNNKTLQQLNQNANKAGANIQKSLNKMGSQAQQQMHKAEQSTKAPKK